MKPRKLADFEGKCNSFLPHRNFFKNGALFQQHKFTQLVLIIMLQLFLKHLLWSQVFSLCLIWTSISSGQNFDHPLYELEERIKEGDKDALFEIALYFDSGKTIVLYIDLKEWPTKEEAVAKRIVLENCQFLDTEIMINDSTSGKEFFDFLAVHRKELFFSPMASCFMLQPLEKWEARFELRELSTLRKEEIAVRI